MATAAANPNGANTPYFGESSSTTTTNAKAVQPQYPPMPAISAEQPTLESYGATGTAIFSGIITSEEYNPDWYWRDGIHIVEQMVRNDAQINATRSMIELPIRRAKWDIEPASDDARDVEIASFVKSCLFDDMQYTTASGRIMRQKWDDILRHILMHLTYGFMPFEVNWRVEDGWVKWARWTPLLPRTVWRWWVGADNELAGIQQWTFKNYNYCFVDIPADKLLLFAHRQEGNNFEGVSIFRSAYKHWWYKENFEKIDAIGIERNAVVPPVIKLLPGFSPSDVTAAQTIAQNMRVNEQMGVTLSPTMDLEFPKNQQKYAAQTLPTIQYHDVMIARNALCQFINLGSTETGAYSLNESQVATFLESLQAVCEYIEDVINIDAIRRLVDYNFDHVAVYPKLKASKLVAQNLTVLADALSKLVQGQTALLTPGPELENFLRDSYGVPLEQPTAVDATNPGSPATPDRPQNQRQDDHSDEEDKNAPTAGNRGNSATSAAGDTGADASDGGASAASETGPMVNITEEARLLREALDAAYSMDAVERAIRYQRQKAAA